ncbi:MAG TPA: universal stress protein, partial [Phototrophicaceae bacterium]|nr:universal stress protein [Phototrophicaceae bacterium]
MLFNNILLAFDSSNPSKKAAEYAINLAALENSTLTFIHVIDDIKQGGAIGLRARYGDVDLVNGFKKARRQQAEEWGQPMQKMANDKGIKTNVAILEEEGGSKLEIITQYVIENNIDLVVMGSRGLSRF